jgi:hypothetical protein
VVLAAERMKPEKRSNVKMNGNGKGRFM